MAFNMKRLKTAEKTPLGKEKSLNEYNKEWSNTIDKEAIPNLDGLLQKSRGEGNTDADETLEAQMDKPRNSAADNRNAIIESQIEKRKSWFPHRQADHYDNSTMMPINALSEAQDARYRKAYSDASLPQDKRLLDKNPGSQMEGPKTKVPGNVPDSGSQLNNQSANFDEIKSMLKSADAALFGIFYKAAAASRDLTQQEQLMVDRISGHKRNILAQMAGGSPAPQVPQPVASDPTHPNGDPQSEFYPIEGNQHPQATALPHSDHLTPNLQPEGDDVIIDQMLNGTPAKGVGGEDTASPDFANIHQQEQQEIEQNPFDQTS